MAPAVDAAVVLFHTTPMPPAADLLRWYDRHRRVMPWRALPGRTPDPYHVWLSEIMLQQTTVAAVIPYFGRFLARFPTVEALAEAPADDVMSSWAGLGYYARARNLHACAREVARRGGFPRTEHELRELPGIGPYTAAAVAAIAFGQPCIAVDGNVERVVSRLFAITEPLPASRPAVAAAARTLGDDPAARARPADFAQALFDLGATLCTPASPACALCPWQAPCEARRAGIAAQLPRKAPRPDRPRRFGNAFWLQCGDAILLRRRPPSGLLGGMPELPNSTWGPVPPTPGDGAPQPADWREAGVAEHGFTHFQLTLQLFAARVDAVAAPGYLHPVTMLDTAGLPTAMRRCVDAVRRSGFIPL